ncbi:phosphate ABC transporter substrate-binding protein PstS [Streptomyces aidingensis]|uniref:Phosphate-binding protein n=1 Tax=Streptomyces aidingensis TaxID=910347 RepID=A0A1I1HH63_9ACTN|nr:phosphate ABC transporter substrate-binding protein PstS [Streptomyces aidingensis]SFC23065.1 phosphate transport system substrate-binding protein [Streptomyces aidingensis]
MGTWRTPALTAVVTATAALATGCGMVSSASPSDQPKQELRTGIIDGAGATFPHPLFQEWINEYNARQPFATITYQGVGSGEGVKRFLAEETDFGSSDEFLSRDQMADAKLNRSCAAVQFPVVFGSVVIAFNDRNLDGLVLTAELIAKIYDRQITHFNDPEIQELNPGRTLPATEILPVHRADGSGTTFVFTHYLAYEVPFWSDAYGEGKEVEWHAETLGADGNDGVTAQVIEQAGALGYVNQSYAVQHGLATAHVVNADGEAIEPTLQATTAASEEAEIPGTFQFTIDDIGGEGYPITGSNWVFAYTCGYDRETGTLLRDFWRWAVTADQADSLALELGYAPMGPTLKERVLHQIDLINTAETPN